MQYTKGTVSINNGSTAVSGSSTRWLANVNTNYMIIIDGDDDFYEVNQVNSDTLLTLSSAYTGGNKSTVPYVLVRDYTSKFGWPTIKRGDLDWPTILSETLARIDRDLYSMPTTKAIKYIQFEPMSSFPDTPIEGTTYYNSTSDTLMVYSGGVWKDATLTPV